jgi:hypothetical protein
LKKTDLSKEIATMLPLAHGKAHGKDGSIKKSNTKDSTSRIGKGGSSKGDKVLNGGTSSEIVLSSEEYVCRFLDSYFLDKNGNSKPRHFQRWEAVYRAMLRWIKKLNADAKTSECVKEICSLVQFKEIKM